MITPLDKLIRGLENKQRIQAQYVEGLSGNSLPAWIQMLRSWPTGAAIVSGAIAILWAVENGPELAAKLGDLMAGKPVPLELSQEQQIQRAIEAAQAKTVAEFRAGAQSDYGLSFTGAQNPAGDAGVQGFTQSSPYAGSYTVDYFVASYTALYDAVLKNGGDPCKYLRDEYSEARAFQHANEFEGGWTIPRVGKNEVRALELVIAQKCRGEIGWPDQFAPV